MPTAVQIPNPDEDTPIIYEPIDHLGNTPLDMYDWGKNPWLSNNGYRPNFIAIQPWMQSITTDTSSLINPNSSVEIDYMKLIKIDADGNKSVVAIVSYDSLFPKSRSLNKNEGALYLRNPWYGDNVSERMSNSWVENKILKINVGLKFNMVSHWWMNFSGKYERDVSSQYQIKCRMRITGNISVQLAADYYKTTLSNEPNNTEAFHSGWFGEEDCKNYKGKIEFRVFCYPRIE